MNRNHSKPSQHVRRLKASKAAMRVLAGSQMRTAQIACSQLDWKGGP